MQDSKYFYEGVPLTRYCKEHEINPNSVRTRIWKKRNNPKYEKYTDQEIINMVITSYGTSIKYMYGDITLRQYCLEKGLIFGTIISRINSLKKKNPSLSNDELVKLAVDEFQNNNYTLYFQNMPLKDYCNLHQEINYNTIRGFILREKEKNASRTTEELVELYIAKEHFGRYKYYYCGIPLIKYCEDHNISIVAVKGRIYRCKKDNPSLSDDAIVEMIMDKYEPFIPKYNYNGMTLSQYCKCNNLSYYSVVSFVKRKLEKNNDLDVDDLIDEGIKTIKRYGIIYYYDGIPLRDYALENGLNASSIRASILRKKRKSILPLQEIVNECVQMYKEFSIKYFYGDETLIDFCRHTSINYNTVIHKYIDFYADREDIDINSAIVLIVDDMLKNPRRRVKYYYGEDSLSLFCRKNGYSYTAIYQRLMTLEKRYIYDSQEEVIYDAVLEYKTKKIKEINRYLDVVLSLEEETIGEICDFLKINLENLYDLVEMGFEYKQAIMTILWFASAKDDVNNKVLTDNDLENIYDTIDTLLKSHNKDNMYNLRVLVGLYRSELIDTREYILNLFKDFIFKVINEVSKYNGIDLNSADLDLYVEEASLYVLVSLDRIFSGDDEQIRNNMELMIRSMLENKMKSRINNGIRLIKES